MDQIVCSLPKAVVDFGYTLPELLQTERWAKSFIEKYFIASKDWKVANSYGVVVIIKIIRLTKNSYSYLLVFSKIKKNGSKHYSQYR